MTYQELQAVADALAEALFSSIDIVVAQIDARCEVRRAEETEFNAAAFCGSQNSRHATLGDQGARQRLIALGILS